MKLITPAVYELIRLSKEGEFPRGNFYGNAGIAPFHDLENEVPANVRLQIEDIRIRLTNGLLTTDVPPVKPE